MTRHSAHQQLVEARQIARDHGLLVIDVKAAAGKTEHVVYRRCPMAAARGWASAARPKACVHTSASGPSSTDMASTDILWRTDRGDTAGVTVHSPDADDPHHLRLVIGTGLTLRLPRIEARLLATALMDAANTPPPKPVVIPIHAAPPVPLYHDPDIF